MTTPFTLSVKQELQVQIRWMIRRDMDEVLNIEYEGFEFPWSEDDFVRCLRQRNLHRHGCRARRPRRRLYDLRAAQIAAAHFEFRCGSAISTFERRPPNGEQTRCEAVSSTSQPDSIGSAEKPICLLRFSSARMASKQFRFFAITMRHNRGRLCHAISTSANSS